MYLISHTVKCRSVATLDELLPSLQQTTHHLVRPLGGCPMRRAGTRGFAIEQDVPADVRGAYQRLLRDGFDSRFLTP